MIYDIGLELGNGSYVELSLRNLGPMQRPFGKGITSVLREALCNLNELLQKGIIDAFLHENTRARRAYLSWELESC